MHPSTSYKISSSLAILLVGDPKSGKTCVAASFPDPYILDVDGNLASAVRVLGTKRFWYDTPVAECEHMHEVWKKCLVHIQEAKRNPEIKTFIIDSLSLLSEYMCAWIIQEHIRMGDVDKNGKKTESLTIPDYGKLLSMFRGLIFDLRSTGKHVVVTSHQQASQDELTKVMRYALAIPGQAKDTLGGAFTDVWATMATAMPQNKVKYEIRTAPTGFHVALGTSIRTLPSALDITGMSPDQVWANLAPRLGV